MTWTPPTFVDKEDGGSQHLDSATLNGMVGAISTALTAGSSGPVITSAGNLGATHTVVLSSADEWLLGTLNANVTITLAPVAGGRARLILTQDATGGRTVTISDGTASQAISVTSTANATTEIDVASDGTNLYVATVGAPGAAGAAGAAGTSGLTLHPSPVDQGWAGWTYDVMFADDPIALVDGYAFLSKIYVEQPTTIAHLEFIVRAAGSGLTTHCEAGLFDSAGTLIGRDANISTQLAAGGRQAANLTAEAGQSLTLGGPGVYVWGAILPKGTGMPQLARSKAAFDGQIVNTGSQPRNGFFGGGSLSVLPSSMGSRTADPTFYLWMAVSV